MDVAEPSGVRHSTAAWHSLHIHRYTHQDTFLTEGLAPAIAPLRAAGVLEQSFFLRYWQGGHHIRLRLKLRGPEPERAVQQVAARLSAYLGEHPGGYGFDPDEFREAQATMAALEAEAPDDLRAPDTLRPALYRPEFGKYGGVAGARIAERFFDLSSAVALAALPRFGGSSAKRLGTAFTMMLRGLCAARLSPPAMADFLAHYCVVWSPYVFDRFLDTWPALLQQRQGPAARSVGALLDHGGRHLDRGGGRHPDAYSSAVGEAWDAVGEAAAEVLPRVTLAGEEASEERRRQVLLLSYLHTHNNRLGLIPEQEAFLGHLGHHAVCAAAGLRPDGELPGRVRASRSARLGPAANLSPQP